MWSAIRNVRVAISGPAARAGWYACPGFFLGIAGTTFAVGIPFVNAWFEPARRGFATGVCGAGMGGTALSAFFTPRLVKTIGYVPTHLVIAAALVVAGAFADARLTVLEAQSRTRRTQADRRRQAATHLADVVPLRGCFRRVRGVLHLPADLL